MNRVRVWLAAMALAAFAALPATALVQTGSILVRVTDEQGAAVPGVAVTLTSPVLVAGTMSGVTDTGGINRFPSLSPGIYAVKVELQGFRTVIRENISVQVGGTSGGLQGVFNARGTTSAQNSSYLNGINVGDPVAIGAAGFYYDFDAFEDIQVSTGAHDITVPTSGVFLNMVTKSGGEQWRGRVTGAWLGDATQTQNIDDNLLRYGFVPRPTPSTSSRTSTSAAAAR